MTSPSTAWKSATARTNRSRLSRRAAAAGVTAEASSTSTPVVSMIRRTMSSSGSPTWERSMRSSAASSANRSSASGEYAAGARVVQRVVEARDLGGVDAVGDRDQVVVDRRRRRATAPRPGQLRARSPSSLRSRGPIAQRGPVSRVSSEALAVTSLSRCRTATTSATSGSRSSPESPTISTGTPASVSASKTSAACALSRVRTPMSDQRSRPGPAVHLGHGLRPARRAPPGGSRRPAW